jgi:hypothetical protein
MRIHRNGQSISSLADWARFAGPKIASQWVEGRSAYELANTWCGVNGPAVPAEFRQLLESRGETAGLVIDEVLPEHRIRFDNNAGEPRNADLAIVGQVGRSRVALTVEAKADEPFAATVASTFSMALERGLGYPRSRGVQRIEHLGQALFSRRQRGQPSIGNLRYQLLTALAGTLAFARDREAAIAVLIVHEFVTDGTSDDRHFENAKDYAAFLHRLGGTPLLADELIGFHGPYRVPGVPLFDGPREVLIGKLVTNRRAP